MRSAAFVLRGAVLTVPGSVKVPLRSVAQRPWFSRWSAGEFHADFGAGTSPSGNVEEGIEIIESLFLDSWDGYWASPEQMGWPLVAIGSKMFNYMSGQIIYLDYGVSAT